MIGNSRVLLEIAFFNRIKLNSTRYSIKPINLDKPTYLTVVKSNKVIEASYMLSLLEQRVLAELRFSLSSSIQTNGLSLSESIAIVTPYFSR
jgi:hypothetical protein